MLDPIKLLSILLIIIIIIILTLFMLGKISPLAFWILIIVIALFAYKILPHLRKEFQL